MKLIKKKVFKTPDCQILEAVSSESSITKHESAKISIYNSELNKKNGAETEDETHEKSNNSMKFHVNTVVPSKINVFTVLCYLGPSARIANNTIKKIYESLGEKKSEQFHIERSFKNGNYIVNIGIFFSFLEAVKFIYQSRKFKSFRVKKIKIKNDKDHIMALLK